MDGSNTVFASQLFLFQGRVYAELVFVQICTACGCLYLSRAVKSWIKGSSHPEGGMWQLEWIMTPWLGRRNAPMEMGSSGFGEDSALCPHPGRAVGASPTAIPVP